MSPPFSDIARLSLYNQPSGDQYQQPGSSSSPLYNKPAASYQESLYNLYQPSNKNSNYYQPPKKDLNYGYLPPIKDSRYGNRPFDSTYGRRPFDVDQRYQRPNPEGIPNYSSSYGNNPWVVPREQQYGTYNRPVIDPVIMPPKPLPVYQPSKPQNPRYPSAAKIEKQGRKKYS